MIFLLRLWRCSFLCYLLVTTRSENFGLLSILDYINSRDRDSFLKFKNGQKPFSALDTQLKYAETSFGNDKIWMPYTTTWKKGSDLYANSPISPIHLNHRS